jgi:hypothetical protein
LDSDEILINYLHPVLEPQTQKMRLMTGRPLVAPEMAVVAVMGVAQEMTVAAEMAMS